jgi:hypothetical protein
LLTIFFTLPFSTNAEEKEAYFKNDKINDFVPTIFTEMQTDENSAIQGYFITPKSILDLPNNYYKVVGETENQVEIGYQIDYKIDNKNWHYDKSWDTLKYNNMNNDSFIYDYKHTLSEDMEIIYNTYLIDTVDNKSITGDFASIIKKTDKGSFIDFSNHTITLKTRMYITYTPKGESRKFIFSDWSKPVEVLKSTDNIPKEIPSPEIDSLEIYPRNNCTNFSINIKQSPEILTTLAYSKAFYGLQIEFYVEGYLIPKDETGKFNIEKAIPVNSNLSDKRIYKNYVFSYPEKEITEIDDWAFVVKLVSPEESLSSGYSKIIPISEICMNDPRKDKDGVTLEGEVEIIDKCNLCGFCPQPLGICIFSYGFILIAVIIILIVIIMWFKRKQEKNAIY